MDTLNVPYSVLKIETDKKSLRLFYITQAVGYTVIAGSVTYLLKAQARGSDATDFENNLKYVATEISCDAEAQGLCSPLEAEGKPLIAVVSAEGLKANKISHNLCDRTTWYEQSVYVEDEVASTTDILRKIWNVDHTNIIDTYHGKLTAEEYLTDSADRSYRVRVTVDSEEKTEQDPHYGTGGDYTVDYEAGEIHFFSSVSVNAEVKVTYHYENGSRWTVRPAAGEILKIKRVECQCSTDAIPTDTLVYDAYGLVDSFAPTYVYRRATGTATFTHDSATVTGSGTSFTTELSVGQYLCLESDLGSSGPEVYGQIESIESNTSLTLADVYAGSSSSGTAAYAYFQSGVILSGTLIQLMQPDKYKTIIDFINDSNGSYPVVSAFGGSGWRGCPKDMMTFAWDFQSTTDLRSSSGMELRVYLEHDSPYQGTVVTATFYCYRVKE